MSYEIRVEGDRALAIYLNSLNKRIKTKINSGLDDIGWHLKNEITNKFGEYHSSWPKLKRASVIAKYKRRALKGMKSRNSITFNVGADQPLILFGDLKKSIKKELNRAAHEVVVFSDNPYAAVHEYGYAPKNIPARSYMRTTLWEETDRIISILDAHIGDAL